jgi:hypothetical protein
LEGSILGTIEVPSWLLLGEIAEEHGNPQDSRCPGVDLNLELPEYEFALIAIEVQSWLLLGKIAEEHRNPQDSRCPGVDLNLELPEYEFA